MPALTQSAKDYEQRELLKENIALENAMLERQKKLQDIAKAEGETLSGRVGQADMIARMQERSRQEGQYIPIEENIASQITRTGGPSILKATEMQKNLNIENAAKKMRLLAMENALIGGKGIVPVEKYDYNGVSGQTIRGQGAGQLSNTRRNVFQSDYNDFFDIAKFQGANDQQAHQMATQEAKQKAVKNLSKVTIITPSGGQLISTPEEIDRIRDNPKTPPEIRDAIIQQWGAAANQTADDWLKSRITKAVK